MSVPWHFVMTLHPHWASAHATAKSEARRWRACHGPDGQDTSPGAVMQSPTLTTSHALGDDGAHVRTGVVVTAFLDVVESIEHFAGPVAAGGVALKWRPSENVWR